MSTMSTHRDIAAEYVQEAHDGAKRMYELDMLRQQLAHAERRADRAEDRLDHVERIAHRALAARDRWVERAHRAEARIAEQRRARMAGQSRDIQQMCDETEAAIADQIDQTRSDLREHSPESIAPIDALRAVCDLLDDADHESELPETDDIRRTIRDALSEPDDQ